MPSIKALTTKLLDASYPGFVECTFTDAHGKKHTVHEKVPVVTAEDLDEHSSYPTLANIDCEPLREWTDAQGRAILTVTTSKPWGIDTVDGINEFDILKDEINQ